MEPANHSLDTKPDHSRTAGPPRQGQVTLMRAAQAGAAQRMSRRRLEPMDDDFPAMHAARRRVIVIWSLILCVTTLMVIGGFMMFWLRSHARLKPKQGVTHPEIDVRIVSKFASPGEDDALDLVKRALAVRDPSQVASFFRLGGATPAEVVEFIAGCTARDGRVERCVWLSSMDVDGLLLEGVVVVYTGNEQPSIRLAFLTPDDTGVWKVDFDAFARSSRPPWNDLLEKRADVAQVRVFATKDTYFNGPFKDESRWVCFGIGSPETIELLPEGRNLLCGYCRVGSPQDKAMQRIFSDDENTHRVILEIRRTAGAEPRQFEIIRVLAEEWVLSATPFDIQFD